MGREDEHAPYKPSVMCAAQALLWWGVPRAWQAEATVSGEACAGAGGVCAHSSGVLEGIDGKLPLAVIG